MVLPTKVWSIPSSESLTTSRRTSKPPSPSKEKLRDKDLRPSPPLEVDSMVKSPTSTPESLTSEEKSSTSPSPSLTTKRTSPVPPPNSKMLPPSELTSPPLAVPKMLLTNSPTPNSRPRSLPAVTPSTLWKTKGSSSKDTNDPARPSDENGLNIIYELHFK